MCPPSGGIFFTYFGASQSSMVKLMHNIDAIPSILKNSNISVELSKVDEERPEEVMAEAGEEERDRV